MTYYNNKTIWITGASSGIGKEMAIQLSTYNCTLVLSSRKIDALEAVKNSCNSNAQVYLVTLDLADHDGLEKTFGDNHNLLKNVDILINNGGISQRSFAKDTSFRVYKKLMDVNYLGAVKLTSLILPYLLEKNTGHFVAISSSAGKFGVPVRTGYSASKFALHGYYEGLRAELHKTNIHTTIICPGYIKTDISKNALTSDGSPQGTMDDAQANGMPVEKMVGKVLRAIANKKQELLVGGLKETHLAVWMSRMFPSLFRKIIAKSRVT